MNKLQWAKITKELLRLQLQSNKKYRGDGSVAYLEGLIDSFNTITDVLNKKPEIYGLSGSEEAQAIKSMTQSQITEIK